MKRDSEKGLEVLSMSHPKTRKDYQESLRIPFHFLHRPARFATKGQMFPSCVRQARRDGTGGSVSPSCVCYRKAMMPEHGVFASHLFCTRSNGDGGLRVPITYKSKVYHRLEGMAMESGVFRTCQL